MIRYAADRIESLRRVAPQALSPKINERGLVDQQLPDQIHQVVEPVHADPNGLGRSLPMLPSGWRGLPAWSLGRSRSICRMRS
ncbi:hypothetical protein D3C81_1837230 [compost metagenome]